MTVTEFGIASAMIIFFGFTGVETFNRSFGPTSHGVWAASGEAVQNDKYGDIQADFLVGDSISFQHEKKSDTTGKFKYQLPEEMMCMDMVSDFFRVSWNFGKKVVMPTEIQVGDLSVGRNMKTTFDEFASACSSKNTQGKVEVSVSYQSHVFDGASQ